MKIDEQDALDTLNSIAATVGCDVFIGDVPADAEVIGSPPASATLIRDADGRLRIACDGLSTASEIEEVLHELAHASGLRDEWTCYEREAVWALRFHPSVSLAVAEASAGTIPPPIGLRW